MLLVEATSRADRDCGSYRLPHGRKLAAIVLALLMPPPHQAGRDSLALCMVLQTAWCFESQFGTSESSRSRLSPAACYLLLRTCYLVPVFVFFEQPAKAGCKKNGAIHSDFFENYFLVKIYVETLYQVPGTRYCLYCLSVCLRK